MRGSAAARQKDGFDLSGSIRLRYEAINNQLRAGLDRDDSLVNLRTTLLANYRDGALTLAAELWDSRAWGTDAGTPVSTGEINTLELVQAYAAYRKQVGKIRLTLQGGRFTLNLGSRRLVAADDYRTTTNGYTGLKTEIAAPTILRLYAAAGWHGIMKGSTRCCGAGRSQRPRRSARSR